MGSTGAFLKSGGFSVEGWEETGQTIYGLKVLKKKDMKPNEPPALPLFSNTPGTAYIILDHKGAFKQMMEYGENRRPILELDYGPDRNVMSLHIHEWKDGVRQKAKVIAMPGGKIVDNKLYNKYRKLLKGLKNEFETK